MKILLAKKTKLSGWKMKFYANKVACLSIALLNSGCAFVGSGPYPTYPDGPKIYISDKTIPSAQSAGDYYHIDDSQIYIHGSDDLKGSESLAALVGFAVNKYKSAQAVSNIEKQLHIHFNDDVQNSAKALKAKSADYSNYSFVEKEGDANIIFFPSLTLHMNGKNDASTTFEIEVRYGGMYRRWYDYSSDEKITLNERNKSNEELSKEIKEKSKYSFAMLTKIAMNDIRNKYPTIDIGKPSIYIRRLSDPDKTPYHVYEKDDGYLVVSPLKNPRHLDSTKEAFDKNVSIEIY
ncbi:hypothetical protein PWG14_04420 (plasmid) [Chromobacterium amazonense]|uniref:hypothetical protein n=1 Tax=Chromobacterium amazonense TaxID=1382803 RepID=UPI00237D9320|nr:hypothetical protein [Chromobacterium amazonense]MDE1712010.1 hypothetical protein [Chromobacterium amazonense]